MKINKILKWSLVSIGGAAVLGGAAAGAVVGINQTSQVKNTNVNTVLKSEVTSTTEASTTKYSIQAQSDVNGDVVLVRNGQVSTSLQDVGIGETIRVKVTVKDSSQTVRDLSVASVSNPSISLGTKLISNNIVDSTRVVEFDFVTPDPADYEQFGMENPFENGIKVSATYIKNTVGNDMDWGYDNVVDQVNSYEVATLNKDTKWSELKAAHGWDKLFNEDSREANDPVNITVYLDGYTLYVDEIIYVPQGYTLNIINLANDARSTNGEFGCVLPANGQNSVKIIHKKGYSDSSLQNIGGQVTLWRSINVWYVETTDGILLCTPEEAYKYNSHYEIVPSVTGSTNDYFGNGQIYVGLDRINQVFNK